MYFAVLSDMRGCVYMCVSGCVYVHVCVWVFMGTQKQIGFSVDLCKLVMLI